MKPWLGSEFLSIGVVVTVVLFVGSLSLCIYEFTDGEADARRLAELGAYNAAAAAWNSHARASWGHLQELTVLGLPFSFADDDAGGAAGTFSAVLPPSADGGSGLHDDHDDLLEYTPLFYTETLEFSMGGAWTEKTVDLAVSSGNGTAVSFTVPGVAFTVKESLPTTNWKICQFSHRGTLDQQRGKCYVYKALRSLCAAVAYSNVSLAFEAVSGCGGEDGWGVPSLSYGTLDVPRYYTADVEANFQSSAFTAEITVRAFNDPFLVAVNATGGSLYFGQSKRDRLTLAWFLLGVAVFSCLLYGGLLFVQQAGPGSARRRYAAHTRVSASGSSRSSSQSSSVDLHVEPCPQKRPEGRQAPPDVVVAEAVPTCLLERSSSSSFAHEMSPRYTNSTATDI
ncbi:hypothetical protein DIPPA_11951 [Diplonema papillatum]|nr:hypothetical protein DIPPA_11951 [Diplonema papillatum]